MTVQSLSQGLLRNLSLINLKNTTKCIVWGNKDVQLFKTLIGLVLNAHLSSMPYNWRKLFEAIKRIQIFMRIHPIRSIKRGSGSLFGMRTSLVLLLMPWLKQTTKNLTNVLEMKTQKELFIHDFNSKIIKIGIWRRRSMMIPLVKKDQKHQKCRTLRIMFKQQIKGFRLKKLKKLRKYQPQSKRMKKKSLENK